MARLTFVVPAGAEAAALRGVRARVVRVPAGVAAGAALPAFARDECVVVVGLCGALGEVRVGDTVIYEAVRAGDGVRHAADGALVTLVAARLPHATRTVGLSVPQVVTRAVDRAALRSLGAGVVDMEGVPLARALDAAGVAWTMVRVVSDDSLHDLPPIEDAIDAAGRLRPERLAVAFAAAPRAALRFIGNVRRALAVLHAIAHTLDDG